MLIAARNAPRDRILHASERNAVFRTQGKHAYTACMMKSVAADTYNGRRQWKCPEESTVAPEKTESTNLLVIAVAVATTAVTVVHVATGRVPDSAPEIRTGALTIKAGRSALLRVLVSPRKYEISAS